MLLLCEKTLLTITGGLSAVVCVVMVGLICTMVGRMRAVASSRSRGRAVCREGAWWVGG